MNRPPAPEDYDRHGIGIDPMTIDVLRAIQTQEASLARLVEAARNNTECWLDIDPDSIPYIKHEFGGDCPGCALRAALADYMQAEKAQP